MIIRTNDWMQWQCEREIERCATIASYDNDDKRLVENYPCGNTYISDSDREYGCPYCDFDSICNG
jgi:hypothetical protein